MVSIIDLLVRFLNITLSDYHGELISDYVTYSTPNDNIPKILNIFIDHNKT